MLPRRHVTALDQLTVEEAAEFEQLWQRRRLAEIDAEILLEREDR